MKSEKPMIKRFLPLIITLVVLAVVTAVAVPTIAYYIIHAGDDEGGDYIPAVPSDPSFILDSNNKEIKNVSIEVEDKGYPVYVRVAILISWKNPGDDEDVFYLQPVEDVDYTIDFNTTGWQTLEDGYYYCTSPVASGKTTDVLVKSCALIDGGSADVPAGYVLNVEIIVQTVQAIGSTDKGDVPAWRDAWKNGPESWN